MKYLLLAAFSVFLSSLYGGDTEMQMQSYRFEKLTQNEKKTHLAAITNELKTSKNTVRRDFLINQLQICGGEESLPILAQLLNDPHTAGKAAMALQTLSTFHPGKVGLHAEKALIESTVTQIPILKLISGIGTCSDKAASKVLELTNNQSARNTALEAIATCSIKSGETALFNSIHEKGFLRKRNIKLNIIYAARSNNVPYLDKIDRVINQNETGLKLQLIAARLELENKVNDNLLESLSLLNLKFTNGLINLLSTFSDDSLDQRLVKIMTTKPNFSVLKLLQIRSPVLARPHLLAAIGSKDEKLKMTALKLASSLPAIKAVPFLVREIGNSPDIEKVLISMPADASPHIRNIWQDSFSAEKRSALLEIMAARRDRLSSSLFIKCATDNDKKLRKTALLGLKEVTSGNAKAIVRLINNCSSSSELRYAGRALAEDLRQNKEGYNIVGEALKNSTQRNTLLTALALTDSEKAVEMISPDLNSNNKDTQLNAIRILSTMTRISAGKALLKALNSSESKNVTLAARGITTLCLNSAASPEARHSLLKEASKLVPEAEAAKMNAASANIKVVKNLAHNATIQTKFKPHLGKIEYSVDDDLSEKYWEARSSFSTFLTIDLGEVKEVEAVHTLFPTGPEDDYVYILEYADNKVYKNLDAVTLSGNTAHAGGILHRFPPVKARYIRLYKLKNLKKSNQFVRMREIRVFPKGQVPEIDGALVRDKSK